LSGMAIPYGIASLHVLQKPLKQAIGEGCRKVRVRRCDRLTVTNLPETQIEERFSPLVLKKIGRADELLVECPARPKNTISNRELV